MDLLDAHVSHPLHGGPSFTIGHRAFRALWIVVWALACYWTPPPLHRWRAFWINLFGGNVHATARIYGTARIWFPPNLVVGRYGVLGPHVNCYCMDKIEIGEMAIVSQGAFLCGGTHDISSPHFQLVTKPIFIGAHAWVAADAFIGPGVTVGDWAVVGARAVMMKDALQYGVYAGNPAVMRKVRRKGTFCDHS